MLLDPLLILGIGPFPRLETAGAAIATVTAQFLVFAVLVFRIFTSGSVRLKNPIRGSRNIILAAENKRPNRMVICRALAA